MKTKERKRMSGKKEKRLLREAAEKKNGKNKVKKRQIRRRKN